MDAIYPFFKWADGLWLSKVINESKWLFPAIEGIHIVALALLFGTVIILNLRLFGIVMNDRALPELADELEPWTLCSLVVILITGALLFIAEAVKSFNSTPFRVKIVLLTAAIIFHYTISYRLMHRTSRHLSPLISRAAAVVAIVLWMSVGFAGRAIGFF